MELERQRGISISSSVLQFDYAGRRMNLLDTPGHQDFSEDTYRTLAAADCAVMLIDSVKGVEPQTIKLFQVCRMRGIPIFTFINKMDRLGRDAARAARRDRAGARHPVRARQLADRLRPAFRGVYDRERREVLRFERAERRRAQAPMRGPAASTTPSCATAWANAATSELRDEIELLETAGNAVRPRARSCAAS